MITRKKWVLAIIVTFYGWLMVSLTILTLADMNTCEYSIDVLHLLDNFGIAIFGSIYIGFLCCKSDLLDPVTNPFWHAIYMFMLYLLIPCAFLDLVFVLILQMKCSQLPQRALIFAWVQTGISTCYSMIFLMQIFVQRIQEGIKKRKSKDKENKYKSNLSRL